MILTEEQQLRLAEIRMHLEKYRALGVDVSDWHDTFFLDLIEQLRKQIRA